jgi:uncharacterized YccA/Bax inhibitor family protein
LIAAKLLIFNIRPTGLCHVVHSCGNKFVLGEIQHVMAEHAGKHAKEGSLVYDSGCSTVATMIGMGFNRKRWILKEHTTQYIWNTTGIILLVSLTLLYILIRFLKKTGRF